MIRFRILALALLILAGTPLATAADETRTPERMERAIASSFDEKDYPRAVRLIEEYLDRWPDHPAMLYNLACAFSQLGRPDDATSSLFRAVEAGFRDFAHMERDPDLDPIRGETMYAAIREAASTVSTRRAEEALDRWKRRFGTEGYIYEVDEERRLAFATALDETAHAEMRSMLQRQTDQLVGTLFEAPPEEYVLIAVPTPRDAESVFGGDDSIGGRYEHTHRRLISRDIGGSLRHEFVHALHYAHMERLGLRRPHALWVQEGLAALYERYEMDPNGDIRFLPSDRTNIVRRRARIGRLIKWSQFCSLTPEQFMASAGRNYPQAREMFRYVAEQGKLVEWYRTYAETFAEDPTGMLAFERVFEMPIEDVEQQWRAWAHALPEFDDRIDAGDASLGIVSDLGAVNDGVLVEDVLPRSAAARSRVRIGDVIVAIDGEDTRTFRELTAIIGAKRVGDTVTLRIRRRGRYLSLPVALRPLRVP